MEVTRWSKEGEFADALANGTTDAQRIEQLTAALTTTTAEADALRAEVEALRKELRIGDKVRVIGKYEADWRGYGLWITGINAEHDGLNYTIGEQWPVPHRHMSGYLGMTDGFREGDLARAALERQP